MGFFSSDDPEVEFREDPTSKAARLRIEAASQVSPEEIPLQEIAGFSELEQQAFELAGEFLRDATGEISIDKAIEVATEISQQGFDVSSPQVQGIIQEIRKTGDLALNRIGRQLQLRGAASTTAGRDIAGRSIAETELATAGALSTLATNFKAQRLQATNLLSDLVARKAGVTTGRIGVGAAAGEAQRSLQQRIFDAMFQREQKKFDFSTIGQSSIASLLLQTPTPVITGGGPSELQKIAGVTSDIASIGGSVAGLLSGLGGLGGGTGAGKVGSGGGLPNLGGARFPGTAVA
jgi:hypothetical protein